MTLSVKHQRAGLITDADNTLWDTDRVYVDAQLWMLGEIERDLGIRYGGSDRLAYIRNVDQLLATRHHGGLRYPSVLLAVALRKVLTGVAIERAVLESLQTMEGRKLAEDLAAKFDGMLMAPPILRTGVKEGLTAVREIGIPILVATEGTVERTRARLRHWDIENEITTVLSAPKSRELFSRAAKLLKVSATQCLVVGDQLDRDIAFATAAGCTTVYFPGTFSPSWSPTIEQVRPDYVIASFDEVPRIISCALAETKRATT